MKHSAAKILGLMMLILAKNQICRRRRVLDLNPSRSRGMLLGIISPISACESAVGQLLNLNGAMIDVLGEFGHH